MATSTAEADSVTTKSSTRLSAIACVAGVWREKDKKEDIVRFCDVPAHTTRRMSEYGELISEHPRSKLIPIY